ncbi:hypothetical protein TSUD_340480 [Trifolium subterraneum]|uniref:Cystatin domain-containing protein n=1 Tax=Trifolium subterraneum TaxID=3900 RepID=A0A2Z6LK62_TRISU|nr:hypothetical protein TSUD_340480 [Trifolium subterraneum]
METVVFGAVRPASESCDDRGKRPKQESEAEEESQKEPEEELQKEPEEESDSEPEEEWVRQMKVKLNWDWQNHTLEQVKEMYENEPYPWFCACSRFSYMNKIKREEEEAAIKAAAEHLQMSRGISPYDAIPVPSDANFAINNFTRPLYLTQERRDRVTRLSKLALKDYNTKNQDVEYEFAELEKVTHKRIPLGTYYITFKAKPKDATDVAPSNSSATTFQAHVVANITGDVDIKNCSIKI